MKILDFISIHAAHAGSDRSIKFTADRPAISIHAAHAGSDQAPYPFNLALVVFQSTLPMRAATDNPDMLIGELKISIHAAHAGSDLCYEDEPHRRLISIHAAHAGSDEIKINAF